jgi:tetratricopeptide (TPR) repeat protein
MSDNYAEETQPLFKLLRTEAFRFVIVRYNHYSFVQQLEKDLIRLFPNRTIKKVDAQKVDYQHLSNAFFTLEKGFFFLENFDDVLKEERNSLNQETPQYLKQNERRRHITSGLNLRRDKLAKYPIALFVFVPASTGELYAKTIMEKMPDLWSFRSWILDLEKDVSTQKGIVTNKGIKSEGNVFLGDNSMGNIDPTQQNELSRLLALLEKTPEQEVAYRLTLFPQIVDIALETGQYEQALAVLNEWELAATDSDKGEIWLKKGDLFLIFGNLKEALMIFEKTRLLFEKHEDKANIAVAFSKLGETHTSLGNMDKALIFYEKDIELSKELYAAYPTNVSFKSGLAISYEKLGSAHTALGNMEKALTFYEDETVLFEELYAAYPTHVSFKSGLAISYEKLGSTHTAFGNLEKALTFYEDFNRIEKELYAANPTNVSFKNGLAISYSRLGSTHTALGNMEKALTFYEEYNRIEKELYAAYPMNVSFKNSLAISYKKLGSTHKDLGNLDKALTFFKDETALFEELYAANPTYVYLKNGLAVSYANLGVFSRDILNKKTKAKAYFKQAEALWKELVRDAPQIVEFQKFLGMIQTDLSEQ